MFIPFALLAFLSVKMNMVVLFSLILALGMLVDNGVVVVENVYRLMDEEGMSRIQAAKKGIGEIAVPIIISTATTVAAFVPLGMWPGMMGEFMIFFPGTWATSAFMISGLAVSMDSVTSLTRRMVSASHNSVP